MESVESEVTHNDACEGVESEDAKPQKPKRSSEPGWHVFLVFAAF